MGERSDGLRQAHEAWAEGAEGHVPAFQFGNERDVEEIARSTGRPVEEVRREIQALRDGSAGSKDPDRDVGSTSETG